ncbi:hypothetical protein [Prosthecomicrobium pneumaticum]|uniref:Uncharacterized protein n=1 Tax=Prosthecomicrobium pneumaticum TaxID=81895 RepID=A0A7W9L295_9HYPH|nr:hypothetical protein [Prosthecomicrobium pneumaticum]MBB5753339.1 hypothetical protein [Prosthecomicrobium pneumaticum]
MTERSGRQPAAVTIARKERAARQAAEGATNAAIYNAEVRRTQDRISALRALRVSQAEEASAAAPPVAKRAKAKSPAKGARPAKAAAAKSLAKV